MQKNISITFSLSAVVGNLVRKISQRDNVSQSALVDTALYQHFVEKGEAPKKGLLESHGRRRRTYNRKEVI